jgi:hypothetical protein
MDWIFDLLRRLGSTGNYNAIPNFHTLQITAAPTKPFPACSVLTSRSLETASNSGDSSASRAQVLMSQPPVQNSCEFHQLTANYQLRNSTDAAYNISGRTT